MDFEYFTRLADAGYKFHYVPRVIAAFRWHDDNVSLQNAARRRHERLRVQHRSMKEYSEPVLDALAHVYRGKRLLRKLFSGNLAREWRLRQMMGQDTLWTERPSALSTCASLASL
jgi:GT2 family glycosyltransferase